ncbi:MAG: hypothetical protein ACRDPO_38645 [Streptosporangiaceae bacterium]
MPRQICHEHCPPGGSSAAAIAAVIALAVVVSAASAVIADVLDAILIALAAVVLGSLGVLAIVLRRSGVARVQRPPAPERAAVPGAAPVAAQAISARRPLAIDPPAMQLTVLAQEAPRRARED